MYRFALSTLLTLASTVALAAPAKPAAAPSAPAKYTIDSAHSKMGFAVRHLMISDVTGEFKEFEGSFTFDDQKGEISDATFTAKTASIDTGNTKRDEHLRSADFFDAAKYPTITLTNSKLKKAGKNKYKWTADLSMHGVTKPVTFDLEHRGTVKDPWGMMRAGFSARTTIKRSEWGLNWNNALEAGGVAVSDEVRLTLDAEATQPKADAPAATPAASPTAVPVKK
jgi:polyisoprenoid-binding protein YceI